MKKVIVMLMVFSMMVMGGTFSILTPSIIHAKAILPEHPGEGI